MNKWDQLTLDLKEYELTGILEDIYVDLKQVEELSKEAKKVILKAALR